MKVGLSYSRCMRDIVAGEVHIGDILVIIAQTNFDVANDSEWSTVWNTNRRAEWHAFSDDEDLFRNTTRTLIYCGQLYQPRKTSGDSGSFPLETLRRNLSASEQFQFTNWLELVPTDKTLAENPAAQSAWNQFQMVAGLVGVTMRKF